MHKVLSTIVMTSLLLGSINAHAIPKKCPSLSKIYSEINMRLEDWDIDNDDSPLLFTFSLCMSKKKMCLEISNVAGENTLEAISVAYDILNRVSENPTTIFKSNVWTQCVYKDDEGYYLVVDYSTLFL